jgi:hypothetical protein
MADHPDATAGSGKDWASVYQVGQQPEIGRTAR